MLNVKNVCYLPSGRIFLSLLDDKYLIESTEMRDVAVDGKFHAEVRNSTDPHVIWNHLVPYAKKWLLTVSTQRGCTHNCKFCDAVHWESDLALATMMKREFEEANDMKLTAWQWRKL